MHRWTTPTGTTSGTNSPAWSPPRKPCDRSAAASSALRRNQGRPPTRRRTGSRAPHSRHTTGADRTPAPKATGPRKPEPYVSWSNHHDPAASTLKTRLEAAGRAGDPPTDRLAPDWRARMEDVLWAVLNSPEFVFTP